MRRAVIVVSLALLPAPALAQYIGGAAPPLPAPLRPGEVQTPAGALARALRTLAQSPRDFTALITAGRAALDLGDTQAAIGFFGRAEEVRPSDPAPKIGMGAATVITGDAAGALRWFFEAQRLGATSAALGADRGLAQDLLGNQPSAQVDYRAALGGREADEARRRLALSLGISSDRTAAFAALQPLLLRRDPAAQRVRAFVLALVGDERGASSAIDQAMPGSGSRMAGFFRLLPTLTAPQKAAAVHLGVFPDPSEIRVAAVSPRVVAAPPAATYPEQRVAIAEPPVRVPGAPPQRSAVAGPSERMAASSFGSRRSGQSPPAVTRPPSLAPPVQQGIASADPTPLPVPPPSSAASVSIVAANSSAAEAPADSIALDPPGAAPASVAAPEESISGTALATALATPIAGVSSAETAPTATSAGAPPIVPISSDRLSGIDLLLAQADDLPVPPAPRPRFEKPKRVAIVVPDKTKTTGARKTAEEEEPRAAIGLAGTNWVQLAGGTQPDRMGLEFSRLGAKSAALRKRGGAVTAGKGYFRLLTGPFTTRAEAQAFVNQLAKDGVEGFSWTRTPATLKIEKLPPK